MIRSIFFFVCCTLHLVGVPVVTSVTPSNGAIAGGNVIVISGTGFTGATDVDFGLTPAAAFIVIDDFTIQATVPPGVPGGVHVIVTETVQSTASRDDFYTFTNTEWQGIISASFPSEIAFFGTTTQTFNTLIPLADTFLAAVISPDGRYIYTANSAAPGFSVIDAATNTLITTVPTSVGTGAFDIVINPSGTRVYISNNTSGYVTVIDTATNAVVADIFVELNLGPLSITPDGATLYVGGLSSGSVTPINTVTNTVGTPIAVGVFPGKVSIHPNGQKAFIPVYFSDVVLVMDVATQTITNSIALPSGSGAYGSSLLPNGKSLYVVNIASNSVSVIDVPSETLVTTIAMPLFAVTSVPVRNFPPTNASSATPFWAAATPDSQTVFVISELDNFVIPIDTATNTVGTPFDGVVGTFLDLVISPDPAPVASFTSDTQFATIPTNFDASASLSPIGTIVSYTWDFGDGTIVTTASPLISHAYMFPGNYNVTLTVTNSAGTSTTQVFSSGFMSNNGGPTAVINQLVQSLQASPVDVEGAPEKCKFASFTAYINLLTWNPPLIGGPPAFYEIYLSSPTNLIGSVPGKQLFFQDLICNRNIPYTYYVVAVSPQGVRSAPVMIVVP